MIQWLLRTELILLQRVSRLDIYDDSKYKNESIVDQKSASTNSECKRGMPLCICAASVSSNEAAPMQGVREAIKNGDVAGVKELLSTSVDSNYYDKQGLSLLHLAALFNQTEIVFSLMEHGARLDYNNSQGNCCFQYVVILLDGYLIASLCLVKMVELCIKECIYFLILFKSLCR
ncbi:hypothetical protein Ancab_017842 [Ancistrocladus abbreviatus]